MGKKEALTILINNSFLLTEVDKKKLLSLISTMEPDLIDALGKFLALEKKASLEANEEVIKSLDTLINEIDSAPDKV
jgi:hypothetical protein